MPCSRTKGHKIHRVRLTRKRGNKRQCFFITETTPPSPAASPVCRCLRNGTCAALRLFCGACGQPRERTGAADEAGRTEASSVTRDTDGTETSGPSQAVISRAPYMPSWAEMVTARLREQGILLEESAENS